MIQHSAEHVLLQLVLLQLTVPYATVSFLSFRNSSKSLGTDSHPCCSQHSHGLISFFISLLSFQWDLEGRGEQACELSLEPEAPHFFLDYVQSPHIPPLEDQMQDTSPVYFCSVMSGHPSHGPSAAPECQHPCKAPSGHREPR